MARCGFLAHQLKELDRAHGFQEIAIHEAVQYELETNRPLYFSKDDYILTYDDSNLPTHYGFKSNSNVQKLEVRYQILIQGDRPKVNKSNLRSLRKDADRILGELDSGQPMGH